MELKRLKISKKKIAIFSVFIFVATIFWFLDALNREYTYKINYPIEFYNFPKDVLINSKCPNNISVTIKAHGYDILGKMNISKPIRIDVSKMGLRDKTDKLKLVISLNKASTSIFPELNNLQILNIEPNQVIFKAIKITTKKVPVKLNIKVITSGLYMQTNEIKILPDSINISGLKKDLQNISFVETENTKFNNIKDTIKAEINLKKINNINLSEKKVRIILPIERYTENEVNIPVRIINCPDSINMLTFPNEVKVVYKVALSKYNLVNIHDFILVADYSQIRNNKEKIHIILQKFPKYIKSIKLSPEYLDYIIKKVE